MAEVGRHIGKALAELWGLDADKVTRIIIAIDPGRVVLAEVSILIDDEETDLLLRLSAHIDGSDDA